MDPLLVFIIIFVVAMPVGAIVYMCIYFSNEVAQKNMKVDIEIADLNYELDKATNKAHQAQKDLDAKDAELQQSLEEGRKTEKRSQEQSIRRALGVASVQAECKRKLRAKHEETGKAKSQVKAAKAEIRKLKKAHGEQYFRTAAAAATAQTEFERKLVVKHQEIESLMSQHNKERIAANAVIYEQDVKIVDLEEGAVEMGKAANAEIHAKGLKISRLISQSDAQVQEIATLRSECEERLKAADDVINAQDEKNAQS